MPLSARANACGHAREHASSTSTRRARTSAPISTVGSFSAGAQVALAKDVRLGFAAGYDMISLGTGTGASAEGERANLGAVAKYNPGPWLFSAAVAGGWSDYDTTRNMAFGGFAGQASGDSDVDYLQGRLHAAYLIQQAGWYAKPLIDATLTELDFDGGTETGGGGAALVVASDSDTYWAISPALEVGSEYRLSALSVLRPFLRGGVTWRDGDNVDLSAGFAAAPAGVGQFTINTAVDDVLADVAAGIDVINTSGAVLRLQYEQAVSARRRSRTAPASQRSVLGLSRNVGRTYFFASPAQRVCGRERSATSRSSNRRRARSMSGLASGSGVRSISDLRCFPITNRASLCLSLAIPSPAHTNGTAKRVPAFHQGA